MTTETKLPAPPYVGFRAFINFLDWLGQVGIPSRIDRSFWGDKLSGITGNQVVATLRFFGLVNEGGTPDPTLEALAKDIEQRKTTLRALMGRYDAALDGLDLERATAGELDERFRRYDISGDTFRKAVTFFVQAAQYCGIPLSPYITKRKRTARANGTGSQPRRRGRPPKAKPSDETPPSTPSKPGADVESIGLHPSVTALLYDLNRIGSKWSKPERDRWMKTFETMIDYSYPPMNVPEEEVEAGE